MGDFVQDGIGLGCAVQSRSVPIEKTWRSFRMDHHPERAGERKRRSPMSLCRRADGPVGERRANSTENRAREGVVQFGHEAVEDVAEPLSRYGGQDHEQQMGMLCRSAAAQLSD